MTAKQGAKVLGIGLLCGAIGFGLDWLILGRGSVETIGVAIGGSVAGFFLGSRMMLRQRCASSPPSGSSV